MNGRVEFDWVGIPNKCGFRDGIRGSNLLDFPDSICFSSQHHSFYVFESGGSRIRKIDASITNPAVMSVFGERDTKVLSRYFSKITDKTEYRSSCVTDRATVYFSFSVLNRIMRVKDSRIDNFIGNGKSGFAVSSDPSSCVLNRPESVAVANGSLYIADSNNFCIRRFRGTELSVVAGHPLKNGDQDGRGTKCLLGHPSSLKVSDNMGYFIDGHKVKYMALSDYNVGTVFESDKMVSIGVGGRDLLILEKE